MSDRDQVLIVGAGPAGITLGRHLAARGVPFVILEKGTRAGSSWAHMPAWLHLLSPWRSNYLLPADRDRFPPLDLTTAADFAAYLDETAQPLPVATGSTAIALESLDPGYRVLTTTGAHVASHVVVATGYYSHPVLPDFLIKAHPTIPVIGMAELDRNEETLRGKRVLIVGKRLSAGQIAERLATLDCTIDVSARAWPKFFAPPAIANVFLRRLDWFEAPRKWLRPKAPHYVGMPHSAKKLFESRRATLVGPATSIDDGEVEFQNGMKRSYDAIVLATGYRFGNRWVGPEEDLARLKDGFESPARPGLFYLGADLQVDFTSRHLRGIRRDAARLAALLEQRLRKPKRIPAEEPGPVG